MGARPPDTAAGANEGDDDGVGLDSGSGKSNGNGSSIGNGAAKANETVNADGVDGARGTLGGVSRTEPGGRVEAEAANGKGDADETTMRRNQRHNRRRYRDGEGGGGRGGGGGGGRHGVARGFLPVCRATDPICPIVRIPPEEGHVFKTKQRAPTLITCEIIVPSGGREKGGDGGGDHVGGGGGGHVGVPRGVSSPTLGRAPQLSSPSRMAATPTDRRSLFADKVTVVVSPKEVSGSDGGGDSGGTSGSGSGGVGGGGGGRRGGDGQEKEGVAERRGSDALAESGSTLLRTSSAPAGVGVGVGVGVREGVGTGGGRSREGLVGAVQGAGAHAASPLRHRRKVSHGSDRQEVKGIIGTQVRGGMEGLERGRAEGMGRGGEVGVA